MEKYVLDTNFFIQSHRITYPLDVAITFWEKVKRLSDEEKIISIDKVKAEIYRNDDELKRWIEDNLHEDFFKKTDSNDVIARYADIAKWAISKSQHYNKGAIKNFLESNNADAWLIAFALIDSRTYKVVTQEKSEPNNKSKIKIPDVCKHFEIEYMSIIGMFRELGETF